MVILAAPHMQGLKFLAVPLKIRFPASSPFQALTMEKSALKACSITCIFPLNSRTSLPMATSVPYPAGVKNAGIPDWAARQRSANVPCGISSTSNSPESIWRSNSAFSPTYDEIIFWICFCCNNNPSPKSSTPALLEIQVRFLVCFFTNSAMLFSGIPHRPNPPNIMVMLSSIP